MLPREKFLKRNISSLSDAELIAILLSTGTKERNFMELSNDVVRKVKGLKVVEEIFPIITQIKGVGEVKAMKIVAGIELGRRLYGKSENEKVRLINSKQAFEYLKGMSRYKQEHLIAVYLNARYEILLKKTVNIGTVNAVSVLPRDVIIPGLECNSAFVLIAHNHPSGGLTASDGDIEVTKDILSACKLVGIKLLDHLIITENGWITVEI